MQLIIPYFLLSILLTAPVASTAYTTPENKAEKVLSKLDFEGQLALLLWTNEEHKPLNRPGGFVSNDADFLAENRSPLSYTILNIYDGVPSSEVSAMPFPSYSFRDQSGKTAFGFAEAIYQPDFVLDESFDNHAAFYGVKISGKNVHLVPHFRKDSLEKAIEHYDQIWWKDSFEEAVSALTANKKPGKKLKKQVYMQARNSLIEKIKLHETKRPKPTQKQIDAYARWAWNTYSTNIALINNSARLPVRLLDTAYFCTTTLGQDSFESFRRHLNFYVEHAYYPQALDFDTPYNLKRLSGYSYVMLPATSLTPTQLTNLNTIAEKTKVILVWFSQGLPPKTLSTKVTQIVVSEHNGVTEALVPQLIFGALGFSPVRNPIPYAPPSISTFPLGRLQFGPPALADLDTDVLSRIDTLIENGIRQQATPGCQVLVAKNGIVVYYQNFGYKTYDNRNPIQDTYLYDLASLTKVTATTQAVMFLAERGFLDLDVPIAHYLPEMWDSDKAFIPVREILAHQAGLYPYIPFWKEVLPKNDLSRALTHDTSKDALQIGKGTYIAPYLQDSLLSWSIHSKRLRKDNAEQPYGYRYSDIGFIILKSLVERLTNQSLDDFLEQNFYAPLGMSRTTYTPLCKFPEDEIVPTEGNGQFRIGELTGYVNDQNAALLGGVSGHAGLFSTAIDLAKLMQMELQLGTYGGTTYFFPETVLNFTRRQYVDNRRGLGWDKPSSMPHGPTSELASPETFGHTGFTGTAVWADPDHQLIFVFLSNRVYPDPGNFKLNELNIRTRIQGLLYEAIDYNN